MSASFGRRRRAARLEVENSVFDFHSAHVKLREVGNFVQVGLCNRGGMPFQTRTLACREVGVKAA